MKKKEYIACSECFTDEGIRTIAMELGIKSGTKCPNCKSRKGIKLNQGSVDDLMNSYFVNGSWNKCEYGGAAILEMNKYQKKGQIKKNPKNLNKDYKLLEMISKNSIFINSPKTYLVGTNMTLEELEDYKTRDKKINEIINKFPQKIITTKERLYRIRIYPKSPLSKKEYDSPQKEFVKHHGRFDSVKLPVQYLSFDKELCIHECRATSEDEILLCTLSPRKELKMLDLTVQIKENYYDESTSVNVALSQLFHASKNSYNICRRIAIIAKSKGFDGIIYPSYFDSIRNNIYENKNSIDNLKKYNIASFGHPIKDGIVKILSIDRVQILGVKYELQYGPVLKN